ncbi:MAG: SPOR domain-containing protein [Gemmatimonadaceae bacterium]|nr:SPOR domain-containing protein [Gemmatimonadaceae bacterium]NUQ94805.1 SPOR domain-containing protein [Gemmatimonadaceae bacterium]NUR18394.1 SPOR domain-containing protein [Gemmatimonadaceae bacterium]NUS96734.1 SPOR domain-containing protein [Gemmatimonadaceae bacterium]
MRTAFRLAAALCLALWGVRLAAQEAPEGAPAADSSAWARAQVLVSTGDGAAGRALVDSTLARIPVGSLRYAEGLYWRAALAANALDAERDYRRVAVEYPLSPRVHAALIRLAQLEMARGDRGLARQHLERLLGEYPPPDKRATAWYWLGRLAFESGEARRGCLAMDSAQASVPTSNIELTNQIASERARCANLPATTTVDVPRPAASAPIPAAKPAATAKAPTRAPTAKPHAPAAVEYTVQVGAFPTHVAADRVRQRLVAQGYAARVVPRGKLFGVRIGRYATRAAAGKTAAKLKAARNTAIVVEAEPR